MYKRRLRPIVNSAQSISTHNDIKQFPDTVQKCSRTTSVGSALQCKHIAADMVFDCGVCGGIVIDCRLCWALVCYACDK